MKSKSLFAYRISTMHVHHFSYPFPIFHIMLQHLETFFLNVKCTCVHLTGKFYFAIPLAFVFNKLNVTILCTKSSEWKNQTKKKYVEVTAQIYFYQFS